MRRTAGAKLLVVGMLLVAEGCSGTSIADSSTGPTETVAQSQLTVTLDGNGTVRVKSDPAGIDCQRSSANGAVTGTCTHSFPSGSSVHLTATEGSDGRVIAFLGDCKSLLLDCSLTLPYAASGGASVQVKTATIQESGWLAIDVTGLPENADLEVALDAPPPALHYTLHGTKYRIVVMAGTYKVTVQPVTVNGVTYTAPVPATVIVQGGGEAQLAVAFAKARTFLISLSLNGSGAFTVVSTAPDGRLGCAKSSWDSATRPVQGGQCSAIFAEGATVHLVATPEAGATSRGWQELCANAGTSLECTFTVTRAGVATLTFDAPRPTTSTLKIKISGNAGGSIQSLSPDNRVKCFKDAASSTNYGAQGGSCTVEYPIDTPVKLQALPGVSGAVFTWQGGTGSCLGTSAPTCTVTLGQREQTVEASFNFAPLPPPPPPPGPTPPPASSGAWQDQNGWNLQYCLKNVQAGHVNDKAWVALPAPFDGFDIKVYIGFFDSYELAIRNRYPERIYFSYDVKAGTAPTFTTMRTSLASQADSWPGPTVTGLTTGGSACLMINKVRPTNDSGKYYGQP